VAQKPLALEERHPVDLKDHDFITEMQHCPMYIIWEMFYVSS